MWSQKIKLYFSEPTHSLNGEKLNANFAGPILFEGKSNKDINSSVFVKKSVSLQRQMPRRITKMM